VRILGADSRGEFREEDQLCAARIASALTTDGYRVADTPTEEVVQRFGQAPDDVFLMGKSAKYLRDTGQNEDLAFVLEHIDDLDRVFVLEGGEVRAIAAP
jgi:2-phosphosulfolactate phosphatase